MLLHRPRWRPLARPRRLPNNSGGGETRPFASGGWQMRPSELISAVRPASLAQKGRAFLIGVVDGQDVSIRNFQSGWVNLSDSQYTQDSPLSVSAISKTQITIDSLGSATNQEYADGLHASIWEENRFKPFARGEAYSIRLTFTVAQATSGSGHFITVDADIGTDQSPFLTASQSVPLIKGQGVPALVTIAIPFFCLDTFGKNGARLFLTPSVDITAWGFGIFIQRTFTP